MADSSFTLLTHDQQAEHRERRAAGEAEIARKEAALAEATERLVEAQTLEGELSKNFAAYRRLVD